MSAGLTEAARKLLLGRIRTVMIAVASVAALLVIGALLIDEGEIVKITTRDAQGREYVTELWIVELPSGIYLRAGSPDVEWLARIRAAPAIVLERGDEETRHRAVPEPSARTLQALNTAMAEKYGFADRLWARLSDRDLSVPIRLAPADTGTAP